MSQPLEPLQQTTFTLAGCTLQAVLLPNGQPAVAFVALCDALALDSKGQGRRIRAQPMLKAALVSARLETAGGPQVGNVLIAWGLSLWLAGIRLASVKPDTRERLIIFQKDVIAVLYGQFFKPPIAAPEAAPRVSRWQALHGDLSTLEADVEADAHTRDARLVVLEARVASLETELASLEAQVAALETREASIEAQTMALGYRALAVERLLKATIERLLEHERRLNGLRRPDGRKGLRPARDAQRQPGQEDAGKGDDGAEE